MDDLNPAARFLAARRIPYRLYFHERPPKTLEEAAQLRGQVPGQVVRSILFRLAEHEFIMVLMAGPGQVSWKRIRLHLGVSRMTMATEAEVLAVTGFLRGAVTPLGLPRPLRILADEAIFRHDEISLGSGVRGVAVIMQSTDLKKALDGLETGHFSE